MCKDLKTFLNTFEVTLKSFDKEKTVQYALDLLEKEEVPIWQLYESIIGPTLNNIVIFRNQEDYTIWKEHLMTSIVRCVIECAYPYVLKVRDENKNKEEFKVNEGKKVVILCPEEEYHEIGPRMGADFFTMANYQVFFIGANTPEKNMVSAIEFFQPDFVVISISNYLNLVTLNHMTKKIRGKIHDKTKLLVSGSAFQRTTTSANDFGADGLVMTFEEVCQLGGVAHETSI